MSVTGYGQMCASWQELEVCSPDVGGKRPSFLSWSYDLSELASPSAKSEKIAAAAVDVDRFAQ